MPAIATGQLKVTRGQTSRIRSFVDGKVAKAKSAQKPAIKKPALAHKAIRYFMVPLLSISRVATFPFPDDGSGARTTRRGDRA